MTKSEAFVKSINDKGIFIVRISDAFWSEHMINIAVSKINHYWTETFTFGKIELEKKWDEIEREVRGRCEVVFNEAM